MLTKEKAKTQKMTRSPALLIKSSEGKTLAYVLSEILYQIKPKESGAELSCIRKTEVDGVPVELSTKGPPCKAVKGATERESSDF